MAKLAPITKCIECPFCANIRGRDRCRNLEGVPYITVGISEAIPEWCPLPDVKGELMKGFANYIKDLASLALRDFLDHNLEDLKIQLTEIKTAATKVAEKEKQDGEQSSQ